MWILDLNKTLFNGATRYLDVVLQDGLPETKCSLMNSILHDIWSKKINFEPFRNIAFLLLCDSVDVSLQKAKWKNSSYP